MQLPLIERIERMTLRAVTQQSYVRSTVQESMRFGHEGFTSKFQSHECAIRGPWARAKGIIVCLGTDIEFLTY
jgi:hypothetical protein